MADKANPVPVVFVVDDEPIISQTLTMILNASNFHAVGFTNPTEALRSAETVTPNLLISDVAMPEMNGVELGMRFRIAYPSCKVLLFSGASSTTDLLISAQQQGYDFHILAKPVHPKDILAAIQKL
jgi:DNA-binding NtrC family response regulator